MQRQQTGCRCQADLRTRREARKETALARGWGLISARAVPKVHSFERRIIMPGQSGKTVWAPRQRAAPFPFGRAASLALSVCQAS
jgi:hypothetical protein